MKAAVKESGGKKVKLSHTAQEITETIKQLNEEKRIKAWNELTEDVQAIDNGIAVAFMSGRPELIKLAKPRTLTEEECKKLYHMLGVLLETNQLLQRHASQVAQLVESWSGHFKGLIKAGMEIEHFANFRELYEEWED